MSHILIDGYNLLAQSSLSSRDELLNLLKRYRKVTGHQITIFFDGTHHGTGSGDRYTEEYVEIIFSPLTVTADDMMEEHIEKYHKSNMVIVSSDRRIQKAASAKRLSSMESSEFIFKIKYTSSMESPKKTMPWMADRTDEEVEKRSAKKGGNPRKKPKKDRQKQRIMKKL